MTTQGEPIAELVRGCASTHCDTYIRGEDRARIGRADIALRALRVGPGDLAGTAGNAGQATYSSAKAGVIGLTKAMAKEWSRHDVTVNVVAFGLIRTRLCSCASAASTRDISTHPSQTKDGPTWPLSQDSSPAAAAATRRRAH